MKSKKTVEEYLRAAGDWRGLLETLRGIALKSGLEEAVKWGAPCYTHRGRNIVSLVAFKDYSGLWFHDAKGLEDPLGVLQQAEGGSSESMRQWRMTRKSDIKRRALADYLRRARALSEVEKPKVPRTPPPRALPPELDAALGKNKKARAAFDALTPGRQRDYAEHIGEAKREATKLSRLEKILPMILAGQGLNDRYR